MLTARKRSELPGLADNLARGMSLVKFQGVVYLPVDYETLQHDPALDVTRRVWIPLAEEAILLMANDVQQLLFATEGEARSYVSMVKQIAEPVTLAGDRVFISTAEGLRQLHQDGQLHPPEDVFCPYFVRTPLNPDPDDKAEMLSTFVEWLGNKEDATSLLHHLATTLVTTWPAVRYVLLIGEGRNGKSLIMKMLVDLFGSHNVSHVTRQQMAAKAPECHDLTNKLLNVVFDGEATYLRDSGMEKTLTAGEVAQIRKLFETYPTPVQTNGLFIEGLNREPKSSDKSSALQKRIVRFHLPNAYALDHRFEQRMRSPKMLGALLALLLDHYVRADEVALKLAPTATSIELKLEHSMVNNMALQFLAWMDHEDPLGADGLLDENITDVAEKFKYWRLQSNDISTWSTADVESTLRPLFLTDRQSQRVNGKPRKVRVITGFKPEVIEFLDYYRGKEADLDDAATVVDERAVLDLESDTAGSH